MKKSKQLLLYAFCIVSVSITSCKKDLGTDETISVPGTQVKNGPQPSIFFNWETATVMPSGGGGNPVPMPWNSGTTSIDPNIVSDYKMVDGWEMVWNTFEPTTLLNDPGYTYYFALYNKYRGQLRIYLWKYSSPLATSYLTHGLKLYGSTSSTMLNYNINEIIDLASNQTGFQQAMNQQLTTSGGTWLVYQYEIAYDPGIGSSSFANAGLTSDSYFANVTSVNLNGNLTGSINGYVGSAGSSSINFNSLLTKGALTFLGGIGAGAFLAAIGPSWNQTVFKTAMDEATNGSVKGFFNGIIGSILGSSSRQPVTLTINSEITLGGNMVTGGKIHDAKLVLPGQFNSQTADGRTPIYNDIMGIFRLTAKPVVTKITSGYESGPWEDPYDQSMDYHYWTTHDLTLNTSSYAIDWNPAIINSSSTGATIANLETRIVHIYGGTDWSHLGSRTASGLGGEVSPHAFAINGYFSHMEQVGNSAVIVGTTNTSIPLKLELPYGPIYYWDLGETAIRISFDVVPNNGTTPSTRIVKTFYATVQ
jgi:hypothetical protein